MDTLPPSREVFEQEIMAMAVELRPEEALAEMLERYFCDSWVIHPIRVEMRGKPEHRYCLHINGNPDEGWVGQSFAHVLTVALLGEYDEQIGGDGSWSRMPRLRH